MSPISTLSLFTDRARTNAQPAEHGESTFAFLERCSWSSCDAIRRQLDAWFAHYPAANQVQLKKRLIAGEFSASFFELFLHELLRRLDCKPEVEPSTSAGQRPDFRGAVNGKHFYLEAAVVGDGSVEDRRKKPVLDVIYDRINEVHSPDFFLEISECELKRPDPPSSQAIRRFIEGRIAGAAYSDLKRRDWKELPVWCYEDEQVRLIVRPIPKQKARGNDKARPISIYPPESRWGGAEQPIRNRLMEKAKRYKELDGPLILAINALAWDMDRDDAVAAIFGSKQFTFDIQTDHIHPSRKKNGLLYGKGGPRYTRVSGILVTSLHPWTIARSKLELFTNPWAAQPFHLPNLPATVTRLEEGKLVAEPGLPLRDLFNLSAAWPEPSGSAV